MNCKPNDLAYVVDTSEDFEDARGRIVKVLSPAGDGQWFVEFIGPLPHSIACFAPHVPISSRDDALRPIGGVPVHDEQLEEVSA